MNQLRQILMRFLNGCCLRVIVVAGFCLVAGHCTASAESELYTVLENDLDPQVNIAEPNTVLYGGNIQSEIEAEAAIRPGVSDNSAGHSTMRPHTRLQRQLWQARISVSVESEESHYKNDLESLIRRINAIEFKSPAQNYQTAVENEPNQVVYASTEAKQDTNIEMVTEESKEGTVSAETLQRFKALTQQPDTLENPLELGKILFNSGCCEEAAICFRTALDRIESGHIHSVGDKAWILLQLGNCLKDSEPEEAQEYYQAVITEFPNSVWVPLAKAKSDFIEWTLQDQPRLLVQKLSERNDL